jgi:hypothetical protein
LYHPTMEREPKKHSACDECRTYLFNAFQVESKS